MADGTTGYVFEAGNTDQLARRILEAAALSGERYERMRLDCLAHADRYWDWRVLAGDLLRFLSGVAGTRRSFVQ